MASVYVAPEDSAESLKARIVDIETRLLTSWGRLDRRQVQSLYLEHGELVAKLGAVAARAEVR